jgi:hypothetical protein
VDRKKPEMNSGGLLRDAGEGRRNTFTAGNGHHLGVSPRARERPGNRYLPQVPGTGGAARGAGESGQPGEPAFRGTWATGRTGSPENLGNRANRNSEAGRPVDLDR